MARVETPTSHGDATQNSDMDGPDQSGSLLSPEGREANGPVSQGSDAGGSGIDATPQGGAGTETSALDRVLDQAGNSFGGDAGSLLQSSEIQADDVFQPLDPRDVNANGAPTIVEAFDAASGEGIQLSDLAYMYDAEYVREGSDLLLILDDGTAVLIENYFAVEFPPDIHGAFGRILTPDLVDSFLRPLAPGQTASLSDEQVAQAQGESIGSVDTLTGEVYAVRPDGTRVLLQAGDPVFQGDQVETADGGNLKITFIDGTIFTLGESARLSLDEMVFDPASQSGSSAFSILEGGFLFVSGQIAETNPNDMTVTTPVATIGIRGTVVTGEVPGVQTAGGETFRFTVVDGEVAVSAGNQTIVLSDNFATASGQTNEFGEVRVAQFVETPENVIARNSAQFRALTPDDLNNIQRAIQTTVQQRTGQTIELDLGSIVENVTRQQQEQEQEEEQQQEEQQEEGEGGDEEGDGTDEEASNDEETLSEEELAEVEEEVAEEEEGEEEEGEEEEEVAEEDGDEEGEEDLASEDGEFDEFETALGNEGGGEPGDEDIGVEDPDGGEEPEAGDGGNDDEPDEIEEGDLVGEPEEAPQLAEGNTNLGPGDGLPGGGNDPTTPGGEDPFQQGPGQGPNQGPGQGPNQNPLDFFTNPGTGFGDTFTDIIVFDDTGFEDFNDIFDSQTGNDDSFDFGNDDDDDLLDPGGSDEEEEITEQVVTAADLQTVNGVLTFDGSGSALNITMDLSSQTAALNITTGSGSDTIKTGSGNDSVNAGSGNDKIIGGTGNGDDFYDGGDDDDSLVYDSVAGSLTVNLTATVTDAGGNSSVTDNGGGVIDNDTFTNIENVRLGDGDDQVNIQAVGVSVDGDVGTDTLDFSSLSAGVDFSFESGDATSGTLSAGYTNFESVVGGSGDDAFTLSSLSQEAAGGSGTNTISFADVSENLTITASQGLDIADGTVSNSYVGFSSVEAGTGNDSVTLNLSSFDAHGGAGNDTFVAITGDLEPRIDNSGTLTFAEGRDLSGFETIDLSNLSGEDGASLAISAEAILSTTDSGTLTILGGADNVIFTTDGWAFSESISGVGNLYTVNDTVGLILTDGLASSAESTFKTFDGSNGNLWSDAANWSTPFSSGSSVPVPKDGDKVVVNSGQDIEFDIGGTLTLGALTGTDTFEIRAGSSLVVSESLNLADQIEINQGAYFEATTGGTIGTLDLDGGTLVIGSGSLEVGALDELGDDTSGTVGPQPGYINGNGTLNYTGAGEQYTENVGTLFVNATFLNSAGTLDLVAGDKLTGTGNVVNAGSMTLDDDAAVSIDVAFKNTGILDLSGQAVGEGKGSTLTLTSTLENEGQIYLGTDVGDIDIRGSGTMLMADGGTFTGSGATLEFTQSAQLHIDDGVVYEHNGGTLAPQLSFAGDAGLGGQGTFHNNTLMDNSAITVSVDRFLNSGTFTGNNVHLNGGTFVNNETVVVDSGSVFDVTGGTLDTRDGTIDFTGSSSQDIDLQDGGRLIIGANTVYAGDTVSLLSLDVNDGGALELASGGTVDLDNLAPEVRFFNGATLDVNGVWRNEGYFTDFESIGTVDIGGSGTILNTGTIGFNNETLDVFVRNESIGVGVEQEGAQQVINNGTIYVGDSDLLTLNGTISGGNLLLGANSVLDGTGTVVDANLVNVGNGVQIGIANFTADTLSLTGTLDVTGSLDVTGTTVRYNTANSGMNVEDGGTLVLSDDTAFTNPSNGTIAVKGGGAIQVDAGETLDLGEFSWDGSSGTLNFEGNNSHLIVNGTVLNTTVGTAAYSGLRAGQTTTISGTGTFINSGTLEIAGDNFLVGFDNQGSLVVDSVTFSEDSALTSAFSGGFDNSGITRVKEDATLSVTQDWNSAGSIHLEGAAKLTGLGTLTNTGSISLAGTNAELAGFVDNDGVINANGGIATGLVDSTDGAIFLRGDGLTVQDFGTLTISDSTQIFDIGGGAITLGSNGVLSLDQGSTFELTSALDDFVFNGGGMNIDGSATNTGTFTDFRSTISTTIGGSGTFTNSGILQIENDTISVDMTNTGTVSSAGGSNAINGNFANSGQFDIADDGTVSIGGTFTNTGTISTAAGSGQQLEGNGIVINDGLLEVGNDLVLSSLDLDSTEGDISVASGETLVAMGATLTVGADTDITGDGEVSLTTNSHLAIASGETFTFGDSTAPDLHIENSTISGTGELQNDGTITMDGATVQTGVTVDNDGTVAVTNSDLTLDGVLKSSNILNVESNGTIDGSGTIVLSGSSTLTMDGFSRIETDIVDEDSSSKINIAGTNTQIGSMSDVGSIAIGTGDKLSVVDNGTVGEISLSSGELNIGTIDAGTAAVVEVDNLVMGGGTLSGDGTISLLGGNSSIEGGRVTGNIDVSSTASLELVGGITGSGTILNSGTMTGSIAIGLNGQEGVQNFSLDIAPTIVNTGLFTIDGLSFSADNFDNQGTLELSNSNTFSSGTLNMNGGVLVTGDSSNGTAQLTIGSTAVVNVAAGQTFTIDETSADVVLTAQAGATFRGDGRYNINDDLDITGGIFAGTDMVATETLTNTGTMTITGVLDLTSGTLNMDTGDKIVVASGGRIIVGNETDLDTDTNFGTVEFLDGSTLQVASGHTYNVDADDLGVLSFAAGATVDIDGVWNNTGDASALFNDSGSVALTGDGSITNTGTLAFDSDSVGVSITNTGSIVFDSGSVTLTNEITTDSSGVITIDSGGVINGSGTLTTDGTLNYSAGAAQISALVDLTDGTLVADGATDTLTIASGGKFIVGEDTDLGTIGTMLIGDGATIAVADGETFTNDGSDSETTDVAANSTTTGDQEATDITLLSDGNYATVWMSADTSVYTRVFDVHGNAISDELLLDTRGTPPIPRVAEIGSGSYIVGYTQDSIMKYALVNNDGSFIGAFHELTSGPYQNYDVFGWGASGYGYVTQATGASNLQIRFHGSGAHASTVSSSLTGTLVSSVRADAVDSDTVAMTWLEEFASDVHDVRLMLIDPTTGTNSVSTIETFTATTVGGVDIATLTNGNIVVVWTEDANVYAEIVDSSGSTVVDAFLVDNTVSYEGPSVAPLADGGFQIFHSKSTLGQGIDIYAVTYNSSGTVTTASEIVATNVGGMQSGVAAAPGAQSGEAVFFYESADADGTGVFFGNTGTTSMEVEMDQGATLDGPGTFVNADLTSVMLIDGGTLGSSATFDNDGTVSITANGFEILGNFDNTDGTLTIADNGTLTLNSGGTTTLDGQISIGDGIEIAGSSTLDVLEITGTLSANNSSDSGEISANLVVGSTGSIVVGGEGGSDGTLILSGNVTNNGFIQVDPANTNENGVLMVGNDFTNDGILQVDNAATLIVGDGSGTLTNAGTMRGLAHEVDEAGIIQAGRIINTGYFQAPGSEEDGFSSLTFQDLVFDNTNGEMEVLYNTTLTFSGSELQLATGSSMSFDNSGAILITGANSKLNLTEAALTITNNDEYILGSGATLEGPGTFTNRGDMTLDGVTIAAGATFDNDDSSGGGGQISVSAGETLTVDGSLIGDSGASVTVGDGGALAGTGSVTNASELEATGITIDAGLTYTGDIGLDSTGSVTINGTLDGDLTLRSAGGASINGSGDINLVDITFDGGSTLGVSSTTVTQTGTATLDSASDTIALAGSEWVLGAGADFANTNGTMLVNGGSTLSVAAGATFNYDSANMLELKIGTGNVDGVIGGTGTFGNVSGSTIAQSDDISITVASFENAGELSVAGNEITFANTGLTNSGTIIATADGSDAALDFLNGGSIGGVLILDHGSGSSLANTDADLVVSDGTLTISGELRATDSEGVGAGNEHDISGNVDVTGTVTADARLSVASDGVLDARDAELALDDAGGLEVGGTLIVGVDTTPTGDGELEIKNGGVLKLAAGEVFTLSSGDSGGGSISLGAEITADESASGAQVNPSAAVLTNGFVAMVWDDGGDVTFRIFDSAGAAQTSQQALHSSQFTENGDIAAMNTGSFVVMGTFEENRDIGGGFFQDVTVQGFQRYDDSGNTIGSFTEVTSYYQPGFAGHSVTTLGSGFIVVTADGNGGMSYQGYNSAGSANGVSGTLNSMFSDDGVLETVELSNGNIATVYNDGSDLQIALINSSGDEILSTELDEFDLGTTGAVSFDIGAIADGDLILTWETSGGDIQAQRIDVTGTTNGGTSIALNGSAFTVNTDTSGTQSNPSIDTFSDGSYIVTWESTGNDGILGQRFDSGGNAVGAETTLHAGSGASHDLPVVLALSGDSATGSIVVVYEDGNDIAFRTGSLSAGSGSAPSIDLLHGSAISGTGELRNENTITGSGAVELESGATLTNAGVLSHRGGFLINGEFDNEAAGSVEVTAGSLQIAGSLTNTGEIQIIGDDSGHGELRLDTDVTNAGHIIIDDIQTWGSSGARITSTNNATLTNAGTLSFETGTARDIYANITNTGTVNVNETTKFQTDVTGGTLTFDTVDGVVNIAGGKYLDMNEGTFLVGADTNITGLGTLHFDDDSYLAVTDGEKFVYDSGSMAAIGFSLGERTTIGGDGTFGIASGATLTTGDAEIRMNGDHYDNNGVLQISSGGIVTLNTSDFDNEYGEIELLSGDQEAELFIDGTRTLGGFIDMNHEGLSGSSGSTLTVYDDGTLTLTGQLRTTFSDSLSVAHEIDGHVINEGTISVDHRLDVNSDSVLDTSSGTISLVNSSAAHTLDMNGTLLVGDNTHLGGQGTLDIDGSMVVVAGQTFTWDDQVAIDMNSGTIAGSGEFDIADNATLAVHDTVLKGASIDVNGTMAVQTGTTTIATTGLDTTGGVLKLRDSTGDTVGLVLEQDFTNAGDLWLTGGSASSGATIDHANEGNQSLTNTGTITVENETGDGGIKAFNLDVVNTGTFSVSADTTIGGSHDLDSSDGSLFLGGGISLSVDGGVLTVDGDTDHNGSGTVVIAGGEMAVTDGTFSYDSGKFLFEEGALTGAGAMSVDDGGSLFLSDTDVSVSELANLGHIYIEGDVDLSLVDFSNERDTGGEGVQNGTLSLIGGETGATLTVGGTFENAGILQMGTTTTASGATLASAGTITNSGTIEVNGTAGNRVFDADIENTGTLDLNRSATVATGHTLDMISGRVDIESGQHLVLNGTLTGGDNVTFAGAGGVSINANGEIAVDTGETLDLGTVSLDAVGDAKLTGAGTLRLGASSNVITGATVSVATLDNDGTTTMQDGTTTFAGSLLTGDGVLNIESSASLGAVMYLENDLTNAAGHTIAFSNANSSSGTMEAAAGVVLTNAGVLKGMDLGNGDNYDLDLDIVNTGLIDVDGQMRVLSGNTLDTKDGTVDIASGQTLMVSGVLEAGTDTSLIGAGKLEVAFGSIDIDAGETFTLGLVTAGGVGSPVTANTSAGQQNNPDIAVLSDGSFWVGWDNHSDLQDEIALMNADGTATGTILTVNDGNDFGAEHLQISTYGDNDDVVGVYVVDDGTDTLVNYRTFDSAGNPHITSATAFSLSATTAGSLTALDLTRIGDSQDNDVLIAFTTNGTITTQVLDADSQTGGTTLSISGVNGDAGVSASKLTNGNAVIAYLQESGASDTVVAKIINDSNGVVTTVTLGTTSATNELDVAGLTNGNFAVSWTDGTNTYASIYDNEGDQIGSDFTLIAGSFDTQISEGPDGGFMGIINTGAGVYQSSYDSEGTLISSNTIVEGTVALTDGADIAHLGDGLFTVAYGDQTVGSGDILVRTTGAQVVDVDLGTHSVTGDGTLAISADYDLDISGATLAMGGLTNNGTVSIDAAIGHFDTGTISGSGSLVVTSSASTRGTLNMETDLTNAAGHTIVLSSGVDGASALNREIRGLTNGVQTLTNEGVITSEDSVGFDVIRSHMVNTGTMTLDNLIQVASGLEVDTTDGTITMQNGHEFQTNGDLIIGSNSALTGTFRTTTSGEIKVAAGETFVHDASTVEIALLSGGSLSGTGTLNNTGNWDTATDGTIAAGVTVDNDGTISLTDGTLTIASSNIDNAGGTISLVADEADDPHLILNADITNAGLIDITLNTSDQGADDGIAQITGTGTITNTGTIATSYGALNAGSPDNDVGLGTDIVNTGKIAIGAKTALSAADIDNTDGTITVNNDDSEEIDVSLFVGTNTVQVGEDSVISGSGTLSFDNGGHLELTSGETFTFGEAALAAGASTTTVASGFGEQNESQVVRLSTGDYWVAYHDDSDSTYKFQRYDSDGSAQGSPVTVNSSDDSASSPDYSVAVSSDDKVIFWVKEDNSGDPVMRQYLFDSTGSGSQAGFPSFGNGTGVGVFDVGTYDANGSPGYIGSYVSGGNLVIQEHASSNGGFYGFRNVETSFTDINETHITGLQNGSTDIVHAYIKDGDLIVRTYEDDLTDSSLNTTISGVSSSNGISLAALTGGGFAVSYAIDSEVGESKVALYDASQSLVTTVTLGSAFSFAKPEVSALSDGNFAVLYQAGSGDVEVRVYDTSGNQVGSALTVVESGLGSLSDFALVADDAGGFAVSYADNSTQSNDVFLKHVSPQHDNFSVDFTAGGTITGGGTLEIDVSQTLNLTGAVLETGASIDNDGTVSVSGGTLTLESTLLDNTGGVLTVQTDSADASVEISGDITNAGTYRFDASSNEATLVDISGGDDATVTNTGTMVFSGGDGAGTTLQSKIDTDVVNTGTITIDGFAKLSVGHILDTTDGRLHVSPAGGGGQERLALQNNATLTVGSDTNLTGDGTIRLTNGSTLNINNDENFVYVDNDADFEFGGTVSPANNVAIHGGGTFTNQSTLELSSEVTLSIGNLVNDGGAITMRSDTAASSLNFAGVTLTNQNGGSIAADTLTGTGELHNEAGTIALNMGGKLISGDIDVLNEGEMDLASGETLTIDGSGGASFSVGPTGTFSTDEGHLRLNNASVFANGGLIALVATGASPALTLAQDTGGGTLINTGTIDFAGTNTVLEVGADTTLSLQSGTGFTGAKGNIELRADAVLAFDHDYTLDGSEFTLDTIGIEFGHAVLGGTGTVTNTGGLADFNSMKLDMAAFVNQANLSLDSGTISTAFSNVAGAQSVTLSNSGSLTLDDTFTNLGTLSVSGGIITGGGTLDNQGAFNFSVSADRTANLTGVTFKNSGVLKLSSLDGTGDGTLQVGDFTNTGTITFDPVASGDGMTLRLASGGDGTLTNAGLITTELAEDKTVVDFFEIQGSVEADATEGGIIHVADYSVIGQEVGSIKITQNLVLNEHSKVIIDSGDGIGNIGAVMEVDGGLTYAGTFELRIRDGFRVDYDAILANSSSGKVHRIDILNEDGSADFDGTVLDKLVIPTFDGNNFSLGLSDATEIADVIGDLLNGLTGSDTLLGSIGDDVLETGAGGTDSLFGLAGNDSFTLSAGAALDFLDGGSGTDLFYTEQLDFGQGDIWKFNNLEAIDFNQASTGTINMTEDFIFGASEDINGLISGLGIDDALKEDALVISGKAGQTLDLSSGTFTATGTTVSVDHDGDTNSDSYSIYTASNGANVYVDTDMAVNI